MKISKKEQKTITGGGACISTCIFTNGNTASFANNCRGPWFAYAFCTLQFEESLIACARCGCFGSTVCV